MRNNLANSWKVYAGFAIAAIVLFAIAPALLSDFRLNQLGKYLCFGIVAVGIGLAWGRGGMLTLGQGVFFGLGAYMMAMHLKIADAEVLSEATVKTHVSRILAKLGLRDRVQLVVYAYDHGLV